MAQSLECRGEISNYLRTIVPGGLSRGIRVGRDQISDHSVQVEVTETLNGGGGSSSGSSSSSNAIHAEGPERRE